MNETVQCGECECKRESECACASVSASANVSACVCECECKREYECVCALGEALQPDKEPLWPDDASPAGAEAGDRTPIQM